MRKKVLVTGAAVGIGRGIALEFARAGYDVGIHCNTNLDRAWDVANEVLALNARAQVFQSDLSTITGPAELLEEFTASFGQLDVLVANAGITKTAQLLETSVEMLEDIWKVDLRGSYLCVQQAANRFIAQGTPGSIVIISSNNDAARFAGASAYGMLKAGLSKLGQHAAVELAPHKIRVNTLSPGWTDTGEERLGNPEDTFYKIPLKRWCQPEEVGKAAVFLCSDAAASVTGARLVMDGGALLMNDKAEQYGL